MSEPAGSCARRRNATEPLAWLRSAVRRYRGPGKLNPSRLSEFGPGAESLSDWGRVYEDLNIGLAGIVNMKRVFVYQDAAELNHLTPHMQRQRRGGIDVRYVKRDPAITEMVDDYIIPDKACAGVLMPTPERSMLGADFSVGQTQIDSVRAKIDTILVAARRL
jgi:hypothetical protein